VDEKNKGLVGTHPTALGLAFSVWAAIIETTYPV